MDLVFAKYKSPEQNAASAAENSNFDLFADGGCKFSEDLQSFGFKNIKIWPQPINILFKNGEDYMEKFGNMRLQKESEALGFNEEQKAKCKQEIIQMYEEMNGDSLKTFEVAVVLAFK